MPEEGEVIQDNAAGSAGSEGEGGEPQGSTGAEGEPVKGASGSEGEPSGEGLFDGMTGEQLHNSYKSLQGDYTKKAEILKKFDQYGGPDQMLQWADYLSKDPGFAEWVQTQQGKNVLGIKDDEMDDQTKQAYEAMRKIAENTADSKLRQLIQQQITPLSTAYKEQLLDNHFASMDKKYGKDWHEMREKMSELSETLPEGVQDRPKFGDVEDLYFKALRETGKFEAYAAKQYEAQLKQKKAKASDKPAAAGESAPKDSKTLAEAFAEAKRAHNMT